MTPGYWHANYFPTDYWMEDYFPEYGTGVPVSGSRNWYLKLRVGR